MQVPVRFHVIHSGNEGKVTVVDLRTYKEVLITHLKPEDIEKVQEIHFLADRDYFYLTIAKQANPQENRLGGFYPGVTNGIRSIPVNGKVYAYHRSNGKLNWHTIEDLRNQMLLINQFRDMSVLLFAVRSNSNRMMGMGGMGGPGGGRGFNPGMAGMQTSSVIRSA